MPADRMLGVRKAFLEDGEGKKMLRLGPDASGLLQEEGLSCLYMPKKASSQNLLVYHWEKRI
jgi:hypothetical protein